jgi:hypothetical protein
MIGIKAGGAWTGASRMVDMESNGDEQPTVATLVAGQLFMVGVFLLLAALPLGAFLALESLPDGWSWLWFAITGAATTAIVAAVGTGFIIVASAICRWQWGFWPNVFWSSRQSEP